MSKNKEEIKRDIEEFFKNIHTKEREQVRKMKKLAMSINLKLGDSKKKFCQKCYHVYGKNEKIRIKEGIKIIICSNCKTKKRWKMK
jgi:RNase P subunit RPR2